MVQPTALNDLLFKKIFATPENSHILSEFLKDILNIVVESVEILNPYNIGTYYENRSQGELLYTEVDVLVKGEDDSYITIELQVEPEVHFNRRLYYYLSERYAAHYGRKDYKKPLSQRNKYDFLRPIHSLNIVNYQLFEDSDRVGTFLYHDRQHPNRRFHDENGKDISAITFFELKKKAKPVGTNVNYWIDFFQIGQVADEAPWYIQEACDKIRHQNLTKEEWEMVDLAEKAREIQNSIMIKREEIGEERGRKIGREEGREVGRLEGRQEGKAEGRQEGKAEGVELGQTNTARKLKKMGISAEVIMEATGLSRKQIEQLEE